jgi:hypothetical protein
MMDDDSPSQESAPLSVRTLLLVAMRAPDSYGFLLLLLLASFILAPLVAQPQWLWIRVVLQGVILLFALRTSRVHRRTMGLAGVLCTLAVVLALARVYSGRRSVPPGVLEAVLALLLALPIPAILRRVLTTTPDDGETVVGALDVYILFGMFFAALYAAIAAFSPTPFFGPQAPVTSGSYEFFSFVTLTTVGYGNLVPATQLGQSLAVVEAVLGQIYLVTLVARLVSAFQQGTRRRDLGRLAADARRTGRPRRSRRTLARPPHRGADDGDAPAR